MVMIIIIIIIIMAVKHQEDTLTQIIEQIFIIIHSNNMDITNIIIHLGEIYTIVVHKEENLIFLQIFMEIVEKVLLQGVVIFMELIITIQIRIIITKIKQISIRLILRIINIHKILRLINIQQTLKIFNTNKILRTTKI